MKNFVPYALHTILLVLCVLAPLAQAEEIRTASPAWAKFTGTDGTGLYFDVLRAIFAPDTIRHMHVPAKRGLVMVKTGEADIYTCVPEAQEGLRLAALPLYEGEFHAFFKNRGLLWSGPESLKNQRLVWRLGYYSPRDFPVPVLFRETTTAEEALKRVIQNGADFYIDDRNLIEETIAAYPSPLDRKDYRIESVGFRGYFPLFAPSARGAALLKRYEDGMRALAASGALLPLYEKWGLPMPRIYRK